MREEDKPFICYKSRWSLKIQPRNAAGWKATGYWVLALVPIVGLFVLGMSTKPGAGLATVYGVLYAAGMGLWVWSMVRWMKARSEVVDLDALLAIKKQQDEAVRKGR